MEALGWRRDALNPIKWDDFHRVLTIGHFRIGIHHTHEDTFLVVYDTEEKKFTQMWHLPTKPIPEKYVSPRTRVRESLYA